DGVSLGFQRGDAIAVGVAVAAIAPPLASRRLGERCKLWISSFRFGCRFGFIGDNEVDQLLWCRRRRIGPNVGESLVVGAVGSPAAGGDHIATLAAHVAAV